jgi:hypothetical protein
MLTFYRHNIRCSSCRMTTRSANTEIMHYAHCETKEQSASMLTELKVRVANMLAKRSETVAAKVQAAEIALANQRIDDLRDAYSAIAAMIGGDSYQGIHKVHGSTGIHTVRAFEEKCTCPGHKRHGHCKHIKIVNDARDAMQAIRKEQRNLSQWLLWQAERMVA